VEARPIRKISAKELISKYLTEGGPSEIFDIERTLGTGEVVASQVRVQLLTAEDDIEALRDAQQTARDHKETTEYGDIYREAQAHEVLVRALRGVEQETLPDGKKYYPPLFVGTAHLRRSFTAAELAVLLNCYQIVKATFSPLETLGEESAETWIARFSDPLRGPFYLSRLDSLHWPGLIALLAQVSRDLLSAAGHELPSLDPTSASIPDASTSDTGSSGKPLSASSTSDPEVAIPTGELLTKEKAAAIVRDRMKKRSD